MQTAHGLYTQSTIVYNVGYIARTKVSALHVHRHTVFGGMLIIVCIIGNSLTFIVFWNGQFNRATSFLFMCLSLTDSAVLLTSLALYPMYQLVTYTGYLHGFLNMHPYMFIVIQRTEAAALLTLTTNQMPNWTHHPVNVGVI